MFNTIQSFIKIAPLQKNFFFEPIKNFSPKIITLVVGIFSAMTALYCSYRAYQFYQKKSSTKNSQNKPSSTSSPSSSSSSSSSPSKKVDLLSTQPTAIQLKITDFISVKERTLLSQVNQNFKKHMDQDLAWKHALPEKYVDRALPLKSQVKNYYSWEFTEQEIYAYAALFQYKFSFEEEKYLQIAEVNPIFTGWHFIINKIILKKSYPDLFREIDILEIDTMIKDKIIDLRFKLNYSLKTCPLIRDKFNILRNKKTFSCLVPSEISLRDSNLLTYLYIRNTFNCNKTIILSGNQVADILEKAFDRLKDIVKEKK